MCHLILLLPVIALPVFWLLPSGDAGVVYTAVNSASVGMYWLILQSMRAPVTTDIEALLHQTSTVLNVDSHKASVWVAGELWSAAAEPGSLRVGDSVEIVGAEGLVLQVRNVDRPHIAGASSPSAGATA